VATDGGGRAVRLPDEATVYFLSGGRDAADWVRNLRRNAQVTVRIAGRTVAGTARVVRADDPDDDVARRLVWRRYATTDRDLVDWRDTALPVAVDLGADDAAATS
jgi:hypothetical protein